MRLYLGLAAADLTRSLGWSLSRVFLCGTAERPGGVQPREGSQETLEPFPVPKGGLEKKREGLFMQADSSRQGAMVLSW